MNSGSAIQLSGCSRKRKLVRPGATVLSSAIALLCSGTVAFGQEASSESEQLDEIIVKGYRGSLANSTAAKRESNGFSDVIFADDIGKLPSQNLAESLNRIPGVKINREVTGEGLQIAVRGLGPSFTKVVLNGNNIAIASDGSLGTGQRNREVDLGVFPAELFTSLSVSKSAEASQLEGGIAGYVNLRPARAFDNPGQHFRFSAEGAYTDINSEINPRGSISYSNTWNDNFGLFVGVAAHRNKSRVDGYETIGYTDGCTVTGTACSAGSIGRNFFDWNSTATADYVAVNGGAVGDPLDLVALTGQSQQVLDTALMPYLGRGMLLEGERNSTTGLISLEYKPSEKLGFALDVMASDSENHFNRGDIMLLLRLTRVSGGNAMIPTDMEVDSNGIVRRVTLYNSSYFTEQREYIEDLKFYSAMPSMNWQISDALALDVSASFTKSEFNRDNPTWLYQTPRGITTYTQENDIPSFETSFDVNGTAGWSWLNNGTAGFRTARDYRETETRGLHLDFSVGEEANRNGIKFGFAYDDAERLMSAFGSPTYGAAAFAAVPDPTPYLYPMNTSGYGDNMDGSLGYPGWTQIDYDAIKEATNYAEYYATMTQSGGDVFGQTVGDIKEKYKGGYIVANAEGEILDRTIRINAGARFVRTDQTMGFLDTAAGVYRTTEESYEDWLPSFSAVYDVADSVKVRASASRAITRANPAFMFPNAAFSSVGIDSARAGNPNLSPYFSDNIDLGGEWYFGDDGLGYVGLTYFSKKITGFTRNSSIDVQFNTLPSYGLSIDNLDATRQGLVDACGGVNSVGCRTTVTTQINVDGATRLTGFEGVWVQPLDMLVNGLGFNVSATKIDQDSDSPLTNVTGISPWSYNFTGYYENDTFQIRATYFHQDGAIVSGPTSDQYDGDPLPLRRLKSVARSQVDLSMSYRLPTQMDLAVTFDGYNLTNEPVGTWYEYEGVTNDMYYPGATYTLGVRGNF
jgi:TonB-dependent receptor